MKYRIYVIEDDENIRNLICVALENFGYCASGFETAEEALDSLSDLLRRGREAQREYPAMFVFDWMLPGMDGMAAIRKIRESAPSLNHNQTSFQKRTPPDRPSPAHGSPAATSRACKNRSPGAFPSRSQSLSGIRFPPSEGSGSEAPQKPLPLTVPSGQALSVLPDVRRPDCGSHTASP